MISFANFGRQDFIEYWSAFQLFLNGENPYNGFLLRDVQQNILGRSLDAPLYMWNPPHLLLLLSPILFLPYQAAAIVFFLTNILLLFVSFFLFVKLIPPRDNKHAALLLLSTFTFGPVWFCLAYGQIGILLTFGAMLWWWGIAKFSSSAEAIGMIICSVKPHLFLLIYSIRILEMLRRREIAPLLHSTLFFLFLIIPLMLYNDRIFQQWLDAVSSIPVIGIGASQWVSGAPLQVFMGISNLICGTRCYLSFKLLPVFVGAITCLYVIFHRHRLKWTNLFPIILATSVVLSIFGWFSDYVLLLPFALYLISSAKGTRVLPTFFILQLFSFSSLLYWLFMMQNYHELFWFPLSLFLIGVLFLLRDREQQMNFRLPFKR